jgi:histidinol dehydrogenase
MEIRDYAPEDPALQRILHRAAEDDATVLQAAAEVVAGVREGRDEALFAYTERFDGVRLTPETVRVAPAELAAAEGAVAEEFLTAVMQARRNIRAFHAYQKRSGYVHADGDGVLLSKRVLPIRRVGVYCPGGTAPLFSSMLMNVIPAQIAGVPEIVAVTPPRPDGSVDPHLLATARLLGIEEIYRLGGAQAVAALAYGTESVPAVHKIVGPGNAYVAAAKRLVFGQVGIDAVAGPSEIVVICDGTANPAYVAADLLSQVEHGSGLESGVVLTTDRSVAEQVAAEVERQLPELSRAEAIRESLQRYGGIFLVADLAEAAAVSNAIAPEHLEIQCGDPEAVLELVENAGAVFLGAWSSEPVGDYFAGTNHVLPTGGAARFSSSLSVYDFLKDISVVKYTADRLAKTGRHITRMAELEGLTAHANAVQRRLEDLRGL